MHKSRIEAFSDGVIAIIITIMVLELKFPELHENFKRNQVLDVLFTLLPKLIAYLLSFVVIAIMWLNHHALFDKIPHSNSKLVWCNIFLLFTMSLIPLPTALIAINPLLPEACAFYGAIMFLNAFAFLIMRRHVEIGAKLISHNRIIQKSNIISTGLYFLSIPFAFVSVYLSYIIFVAIPFWYFIPDKFYVFIFSSSRSA